MAVFYIYYMSCTRPGIDLHLVVKFSVKWNTNGLKKETGVFVAGGIGLDGNMATGNHLGRIARLCQYKVTRPRQVQQETHAS